MLLLIVGLLIFLGVHSINFLAPNWRQQRIHQLGALPWKGLYAIASLLGFALLVIGYGQARLEPTWLWLAPTWTRHLAALITLPAFILLLATYVPGTHIKARIGHPMLLATKVWALSHLIANGGLHDVLLFGGFLAWAVFGFIVLRKRDRAADKQYPAVGIVRDVIAVVLGLVAWAAFAMVGHVWLIGVAPFGG
ncbi:hypothetical protein CHH28_07570 [Bacterioplanes sanyensis]|uniref:NnrU domain-containing protein n=1 Tax=Bacterioplanes sanyensis TaxID=1249553 RepID=A0A222FJE0_9GAMM|nr:NnrU family protein [Bacterioplanes sanyensis]ASP38541.1 hypothetical protein CHH28_07570 [Bacterioplanes sanyensis]